MGVRVPERSWDIWSGLVLLPAAGALLLGWGLGAENRLLLAGLILVALLPMIVRWPIPATLGVYAFLVPFDSIVVLGEGTTGPTLTRLVGAATAGILLATGLVGWRFTRPPSAALWWLLFTLWGAATALWALDSATVLDRLPTSVSLFLVYLVAVSIRVSEKDLSPVWTMTILGAAIAAAYAYYMYSQGIFYAELTGRASLIRGERETDPNQFATSLLIPLGLAVARFLKARGALERLLQLCAMGVIATGFYLTMSRGALLALLVMVLAYLYRTRSNWRAGVPIAGLALLVIIMPDRFFERIVMYETAVTGRSDIWWVGLQALREHGILGVGLGNFPLAYSKYGGNAYSFFGSHNIYLGMWVELGIVGLFFMVAGIVSQMRSLKVWRRTSAGQDDFYLLAVECACFGVLVSGFFLDIVLRKAFWLPWIFLVLAMRAQKDTTKGLPS